MHRATILGALARGHVLESIGWFTGENKSSSEFALYETFLAEWLYEIEGTFLEIWGHLKC